MVTFFTAVTLSPFLAIHDTVQPVIAAGPAVTTMRALYPVALADCTVNTAEQVGLAATGVVVAVVAGVAAVVLAAVVLAGAVLAAVVLAGGVTVLDAVAAGAALDESTATWASV
jgi:hypothetical protein